MKWGKIYICTIYCGLVWVIEIPWLERVVPDNTLLFLRHVLPGGGVSEVHQGFSIQKAKAKAAVDHQSCSVPFPAWIIGQRIKLRGPDDDVLQVSPGQIRANGQDSRAVSIYWHWYHQNIISHDNISVVHTFAPVPGRISQQPVGPMLMFQCESECTRCVDQHSSESKQANWAWKWISLIDRILTLSL